MKFCHFILLITLLSLYACQSLGLFHEQFLKEIKKFETDITNDHLNNAVNKYMKQNKIGKEYTLKTVNLDHIYSNCNLDFEIQLVQSQELPASNHQIAHINIGGALIPGITPKYKNYWRCVIGVVIKGSEPNTVYSLMYNLNFEFNKSTFEKDYNVNLSYVDEKEVVNFILYTIAYKIYTDELLPIKG